MNTWICRLSFAAVIVVSTVASAAEVDVLQWNLSTSVVDSTPSIPQIDVQRSQTPQNPFFVTQATSLGPTAVANGYYDVSWLNDSGSFHLEADQFLHGPGRSAFSGGQVFLTTTIDLVFNASGGMTFTSTSGDEADFSYGLQIRPTGPGSPAIFADGGFGGDFHLETPPSGSLAFNSGDILLVAGRTYQANINILSHTYTSPDQDPISVIGEIDFSWRPAPEPTTALLLAFAGVAVFRRRRISWLSSSQDQDAPSPAPRSGFVTR